MRSDTLAQLIKEGEPSDEIWQEAIRVSENIVAQYDMVVEQTLAALSAANHPDTWTAIATCLIEHLLEHDFSGFDKFEAEIRAGNDKCLYALSMSRKMGCSKVAENATRWDALVDTYRRRLQRIRNKYPFEDPARRGD